MNKFAGEKQLSLFMYNLLTNAMELIIIKIN
jgi:hypothetical protein